MEILEALAKCEVCGKSGEDLSLYSANHKDWGWIKICRECWIRLYEDNRMVAASSSSSKGSASPCSSCPGCHF